MWTKKRTLVFLLVVTMMATILILRYRITISHASPSTIPVQALSKNDVNLLLNKQMGKAKESDNKVAARVPTVSQTFPKATNHQMMLECSQVTSGGNVNAGVGDVKALKQTDDKKFKPVDDSMKCTKKLEKRSRILTTQESEKVNRCIQTSTVDATKGNRAFWSHGRQSVRHRHHTYLTSSSIVIDIGGNVGKDANDILNAFHPNAYVVIEPLYPLYQRLVHQFKTRSNVFVYNFGAGDRQEVIHVHLSGNVAQGTSVFKDAAKTGCLLKVVNVTEFLLKVGVGCFDTDLITINCEGCEYAVLESILSSNIISFFKHVQFASHPNIRGLKDPIPRYCAIQELLRRTHVLSYHYKFTWETWKRRDLAD